MIHAPLSQITQPGLYENVPEAAYHTGLISDGIKTWSRSELKAWRAATTPAHFHRDQLLPSESKKEFDLGAVAHHLVLGVGAPIACIRAFDWRSPTVRALREDARAAGQIPLLVKDYEIVQAMAAAVRNHPEAAALLAAGKPEVTGFWQDPETGLWLRIRIDWLTSTELVDYKTADTADLEWFAKAAFNDGYYLQHPMYTDVARNLGHRAERFRLIVQEKTPPYEVAVYELDDDSVELGRLHYREALRGLAECVHADTWPGFDQGTTTLRLPRWAFPYNFAPAGSWDGDDTPTDPGDTSAIDYLNALMEGSTNE